VDLLNFDDDNLTTRLNNTNPEMRIKAIDSVNDQFMLYMLATTDPDSLVRIEAIRKLKNCDDLLDVIELDYCEFVKAEAVKKTINIELFKDVKTDENAKKNFFTKLTFLKKLSFIIK